MEARFGQGLTQLYETVLPIGLTVMIRECSNPNCPFFEKLVYADGKALYFEHFPKDYEPKEYKTKLSKRDIKKAEELIKYMQVKEKKESLNVLGD